MCLIIKLLYSVFVISILKNVSIVGHRKCFNQNKCNNLLIKSKLFWLHLDWQQPPYQQYSNLISYKNHNQGNQPHWKQQFPATQRTARQGAELFDNKNCGLSSTVITNKIFGGETTDIGEFPWMALLQYFTRSGLLVISCDGILISTRYVLTAAHCISGSILENVGTL